MILSSPLLQGNPALRDQVSGMMPAFLQQLQNPTNQQLMTNPNALSALMQIQQGLQSLQVAAPELVQG